MLCALGTIKSSPSTLQVIPQALKAKQNHPQVTHASLCNPQLRSSHRRQTNERTDFDVVGPMEKLPTVRASAMNRQLVRSDSLQSAHPASPGSCKDPERAVRQAALRKIVVPVAATAAVMAFSVPVTLGSHPETRLRHAASAVR